MNSDHMIFGDHVYLSQAGKPWDGTRAGYIHHQNCYNYGLITKILKTIAAAETETAVMVNLLLLLLMVNEAAKHSPSELLLQIMQPDS